MNTIENEVKVHGMIPQALRKETRCIQDGEAISMKEKRDGGYTAFGVGFVSRLQAQMPLSTVWQDKRVLPEWRPGPLMEYMPSNDDEMIVAAAIFAREVVLSIPGDIDYIDALLEVVRRRRTICLVVTRNDDTASKWAKAFDARLQYEVGAFDGDGPGAAKAAVCTASEMISVISSLDPESLGKSAWDALGFDPGLIIVDECDEFDLETLRKVSRYFRPSCRCGIVHRLINRGSMHLICHEFGPEAYDGFDSRPGFMPPAQFDWSGDRK